MSDDDAQSRSLRELGKQLPYDKPDADRREALRSALLVAATQRTSAGSTPRKRWLLVGGGFAAGALAAAALAIIVISPRGDDAPPRAAHARIAAPKTASLEHTVTATSTGTDEVIRVRAGTVKVAVPTVRKGDRVRMQTADAEVEATGAYEVAVIDDRLERVTVAEGTARITTRSGGTQQQVFLAAGQTWRPTVVTAAVETTEVELAPPPSAVTSSDTAAGAASTATPATPNPTTTNSATTNPTTTNPTTTSPATTNVASTTRVDRPSRVEPSRVESPRVEPSRVEPSRVEPPRVEPSRVEPSRVEPSRVEPSRVEPSRVEPSRVDPPSRIDAPTPPSKSTTEQHFQRGWKLLRDNKPREAAIELGRAADADTSGRDALAADARYFQAVALVRAGQPAAAERVLVAFIDRAGPSALRRGRAAVLLGKLLRDRGDVKSARAWFESALGDPDPAIAAAARAHLDALR